jgi:hypothetical protein
LVGIGEAPRNLRVVEQVPRRKWARRRLALEAGQAVFHVVGKPGLAHLAIADDVDPGHDLALDSVVHGGPHALVELFARWRRSVCTEQRCGEVRRPGQAAGVSGENPLRASLHDPA